MVDKSVDNYQKTNHRNTAKKNQRKNGAGIVKILEFYQKAEHIFLYSGIIAKEVRTSVCEIKMAIPSGTGRIVTERDSS